MTDRNYADIWIDELNPPYVRMGHTVWPGQNAHRVKQRAIKLAQNYSQGWHCAYCGDLMPEWKRIDAKYCKEGCRKMAARKRRTEKVRSKTLETPCRQKLQSLSVTSDR